MATKPMGERRTAVALAYKTGHAAPRVVAKGRGELAETIIAKAQEAGLFVHESPELVSLLMQVDLDKSIPAELYQAVSEILAFVYYLERQSKGSQMVDDILAAYKSGLAKGPELGRQYGVDHSTIYRLIKLDEGAV